MAEDVRWKIIEAVFRQESTKGHLRWSLTGVAKAARVSRSLVYYHFGKTKQEVLFGCLGMLAEEFYGLQPERRKMPLAESLLRSHAMYFSNPAYAVFFQRWRFTPSRVQDALIAVEAQFERQLRKQFPKAAAVQIRGLHALFHGLTTAAYLDDKSLRAALDLLRLEKLIQPLLRIPLDLPPASRILQTLMQDFSPNDQKRTLDTQRAKLEALGRSL